LENHNSGWQTLTAQNKNAVDKNAADLVREPSKPLLDDLIAKQIPER